MERRQLLTINEAAKAMGVSRNHVRRLVEEADVLGKKARWRYGREIVDLSPVDAVRRTLRINIAAVLPQK
jgi:excisionase family DNA binding protein